MIVYKVQCSKGHVFEEWFASSTEYDTKSAAHDIACPDCGDTEVSKAIMAPNVATGAQAPAGPCGQPICQTGCAYADS